MPDGGGGQGGPPDKWVGFNTFGLGSDEVLVRLNRLAQQGYYTAAVAVNCTDGPFVFVGGYTD